MFHSCAILKGQDRTLTIQPCGVQVHRPLWSQSKAATTVTTEADRDIATAANAK